MKFLRPQIKDNILKQIRIEESDAPYKYNVQIWTSQDAGETYQYCGNGKFFQTETEVTAYINKISPSDDDL